MDIFDLIGPIMVGPSSSHTAGAVRIGLVSRKLLGEEGLVKYTKTPGGEDFAFFLERTPGVYAFVGCRNEEKDCVYSLHHDHFDLDEEGLFCGAAFYVQYLLDAQQEQW